MADELAVNVNASERPLRVLGWAAFLGASWTWCIGMFLPVLLVRDYGLWAWLVFAIPNVVGAAAMAWVLRDAEASARVMNRHLPAVLAFSLVTIAFHLFFLFCVLTPLVGSWFVQAIALLAALIVYLLAHQLRGGWLIAAAVTLAVSVVVFVLLGARGALALPAQQGQWPASGLLWLAPVCALGFALCPYLDVTFHRARQALSPAGGRLAFAIGFGVFFLAMIVLTLLYAPLLIVRGAAAVDPAALPAPQVAVWLVAAHIAVQLGFTVAAHAQHAGRRLESVGMETATVLVFAVLGLLIAGLIASARVIEYHGLSGPELIYRLFMAFYGLVFPAYVWICMMPAGRRVHLVPRRALIAFVAATVVAAPMYWIGFIERRTVWLLPGVGVVLLAGLIVRLVGPRVNHEALATLRRSPGSGDPTKDFLTAAR